MRQAWHTIPSCVYRSLRSLHICHPSQCMRGHSKTPLHFVLVGRKLRVFRSGPSISKLSRFPNKALWLLWVPQKGTYAVRFRSIFLLDRYFPIATPSPHQLDRYNHVWTQGFRSAVGSTSPEFSRFYLLFLHGRKTLWEVWRLHEVAGF